MRTTATILAWREGGIRVAAAAFEPLRSGRDFGVAGVDRPIEPARERD